MSANPPHPRSPWLTPEFSHHTSDGGQAFHVPSQSRQSIFTTILTYRRRPPSTNLAHSFSTRLLDNHQTRAPPPSPSASDRMFPSTGTKILLSDYSDDVEAHIPLLSLESTHTWFRPPPKSSSSSQASSSQPSTSRAAFVAPATNYKTIPTPEATSIKSHDSAEVDYEMEWEKYETLLMSLWGLIYFSTLLIGILLLIWGSLAGRAWPKVVGGVFVGLHVLVCVGLVIVESHFEGMEAKIQVEV